MLSLFTLKTTMTTGDNSFLGLLLYLSTKQLTRLLVYLSTRLLLHKFPCRLFCFFINYSYLCPKLDDIRRWQSVLIRCYWRYLLKSNSRKIWLRHEDDSNGTTSLVVCSHYWLYAYSFGVGCYCFIHAKAMREARFQDKTNIVPTPYFLSAIFWESCMA